ncbi:MAG: DUF1329 domain-containing protein [Steroidobacteraceae bacterium]
MHRVWVVEATLKDGMRHIFPRRVMCIDEDSWTLILTDLYDAQGKIWRVQEASLWVAPEIGLRDRNSSATTSASAATSPRRRRRASAHRLARRPRGASIRTCSFDELRRRGER